MYLYAIFVWHAVPRDPWHKTVIPDSRLNVRELKAPEQNAFGAREPLRFPCAIVLPRRSKISHTLPDSGRHSTARLNRFGAAGRKMDVAQRPKKETVRLGGNYSHENTVRIRCTCTSGTRVSRHRITVGYVLHVIVMYVNVITDFARRRREIITVDRR